MRPRQHAGVSLVEVLVAVAVSAVGLIGMAGLIRVSAKFNHAAWQRTELEFLVESLAESMHVNQAAVVAGAYDGGYTGDGAAGPDCRQGCPAQARAAADRARFAASLAAVLPDFHANMACRGGGMAIATAYDGVCRFEVAWSERARAAGSDAVPQSLVWMFQP